MSAQALGAHPLHVAHCIQSSPLKTPQTKQV